MGLHTHHNLITVKQRNGRGTDIEGYVSEVEMVHELMDTGSIADGVHGSEAHVKALEGIITRAQAIIQEIKVENEKPGPEGAEEEY